MPPVPVLTGPRCTLRPAQMLDAAVLQDCFGSGETFFGLEGPSATLADVERWLSTFLTGDPAYLGAWAVTLDTPCEAMGLVLYGDRNLAADRLTVAFLLKQTQRNKGLMTAALLLAIRYLLDQGVHRIEAEVQPANLASRRLLTRIGFRQEGGLMRDRIVVRGMRRSTLLFALLSPDFWMTTAEREGGALCAV